MPCDAIWHVVLLWSSWYQMKLHYLSGNTQMTLIFARLALRDKKTSERMYVISIGYHCCQLRLWKGTWYREKNLVVICTISKLEKSIHFLSWARDEIINLFRGWDIKICNYSNVWLPFCLLHLIPWGYRKWIRSITSVSVSVKIIIFSIEMINKCIAPCRWLLFCMLAHENIVADYCEHNI